MDELTVFEKAMVGEVRRGMEVGREAWLRSNPTVSSLQHGLMAPILQLRWDTLSELSEGSVFQKIILSSEIKLQKTYHYNWHTLALWCILSSHTKLTTVTDWAFHHPRFNYSSHLHKQAISLLLHCTEVLNNTRIMNLPTRSILTLVSPIH